MSIEVQVPEIGESVATVFVSRWLKSPGDKVSKGEGIVELDSDKASMELPSPEDGVLEEQLAEEGDEVDVGSVIARLGDGSAEAADEEAADEEAADEEAADEEAADEEAADERAADEEAADERAADEAEEAAEAAEAEGPRAGPAARAAARERGIDLAEVEGTGKGGRITREDVEKAAEGKGAEQELAEQEPAEKEAEGRPSRAGPEADQVERVPMSPLRRTISRRLVQVQNDAAILTTFNEIDMGAVMAMRKKYQDRFVDKYDIKLGFMSFFVKACVSAAMEYPAVNAEVDGTDLVYKHYYNIGVAVSGPKGLVVPVVRHADQLSFAEVEGEIARLAKKARDNKLELSDFQDGTFTISNGGIFGSMMSTPILNPPQVGILGMHNIVKRPMVVQNDAGDDEIAIRPMMYVALSYDHRIIDGREAVSFLKRVKELVEDPERILIEV